MKKFTVTVLALAAFFILPQVNAQDFADLDPSPLDVSYFPDKLPYNDLRSKETTSPTMKIYYSRPQVKGREMIGAKAVPFGKMWRLGANEATEITFYQDVTIGTSKVKAGTYTVFATPEADKWTFTLHSKLNTWGNYALQGSEEIATVVGSVEKSDKVIEALSMMFEATDGGANLVIGWENTIARMPIKL